MDSSPSTWAGCPISVLQSVASAHCETLLTAAPTCTGSDPACCSSYMAFETVQANCLSSYAPACYDYSAATAPYDPEQCATLAPSGSTIAPMTTSAAGTGSPTALISNTPASGASATSASSPTPSKSKGAKVNAVRIYVGVALIGALAAVTL